MKYLYSIPFQLRMLFAIFEFFNYGTNLREKKKYHFISDLVVGNSELLILQYTCRTCSGVAGTMSEVKYIISNCGEIKCV